MNRRIFMECEVRYYYKKECYDELFNKLNNIDKLKYKGKFYEKTYQYNHPSKKYDFYSKNIDGRFRIRITKKDNLKKCMISWKRRLKNSLLTNKQEEVELSIKDDEIDNLFFIINNVLHLRLVESYERYRSIFYNEDVEIALDLYPFGLALEIEAKKNSKEDIIINEYLKLLDLKIEDSYKLSWDDKYEELCKDQNKKIEKEVLFEKDMPQIM